MRPEPRIRPEKHRVLRLAFSGTNLNAIRGSILDANRQMAW